MGELECIELDRNDPMVCCGCSRIGPRQTDGQSWGGWYLTGVVYVGYMRYETAAHCPRPECAEVLPLSVLEDMIKRGYPPAMRLPTKLILAAAALTLAASVTDAQGIGKPWVDGVLRVSRAKISEDL